MTNFSLSDRTTFSWCTWTPFHLGFLQVNTPRYGVYSCSLTCTAWSHPEQLQMDPASIPDRISVATHHSSEFFKWITWQSKLSFSITNSSAEIHINQKILINITQPWWWNGRGQKHGRKHPRAVCDQHIRSAIQQGLWERAGQAGRGKATHPRLRDTPRCIHVCNSIYLHVYTLDISWRVSLPCSFFSTSKEDIKQEKHLLKQQANLYI